MYICVFVCVLVCVRMCVCEIYILSSIQEGTAVFLEGLPPPGEFLPSQMVINS